MADRGPVPHYPPAIDLPGFVKNDMAVSELLIRAVVLWFVLTGCLHTVFEGYYVMHHASLAGQMDLMGQLWKEYALSDSRYLTQDTFVLSIETLTALLLGPLSFSTAAAIVTLHPMRHSLQLIVSVAHIYGCALYFATATVDWLLKGTSHTRPEFVYVWIYYFGMNAVFMLIPGVLVVQSLRETLLAFAALDEKRSKRQANGSNQRPNR
ncbi:hypothetical protein DV735_g4083, partial [Chaetothyriales sp. CBS 134920]